MKLINVNIININNNVQFNNQINICIKNNMSIIVKN